MPPTRADVLWFLMVETALFVFAALVHRGVFFAGFEHERAALIELVIAVVLAAGLIYSFGRSEATRRIGIFVQGFALLALVGGFIALNTGPAVRPTLDWVIYVIMFITLLLGVLVARRAE